MSRARGMLARAALIGAVLPGALAPAAAHADDPPPALPSATDRCVGASPVVAARPSWAAQRMAPSLVWPLTRGAGVLVAVVDSGVSASAPALAQGVLPGVDVVRGGRADSDCRGRGTALAGIIAARPATGSGVVGMAPAAQVLPVRIVDARGAVPPDALAKGIRAATAAGAGVILVGTGVTAPDSALRAAVAEAAAHDVVVVAAVAGGTADPGQIWYPAAYDEVLAVNGVNNLGTATASPHEAGVDLVAPATEVLTIGPVGAGHYRVGGSAVAAAHVAGAAALLRAYRPELTQEQVRARLQLTAEHPTGAARTDALGAGTLDPYAAVSALEPEQQTRPVGSRGLPVTVPAPPAPDASVSAALTVAASSAAGVALVFAAVVTVTRGRRRRWRPW